MAIISIHLHLLSVKRTLDQHFWHKKWKRKNHVILLWRCAQIATLILSQQKIITLILKSFLRRNVYIERCCKGGVIWHDHAFCPVLLNFVHCFPFNNILSSLIPDIRTEGLHFVGDSFLIRWLLMVKVCHRENSFIQLC